MNSALISGASGGLGKEFAYLLAERGYDVILVARSQNKLKEIANDIKTKYNVKTDYIVMDLSKTDAAELLFNKIAEKGISVNVLINNAGFGKFGDFFKYNIDVYEKMILLNVLALTNLTYAFGNNMVKNGGGKILNISSTAAFQPLPRFAVYAATKAYVLSFSEALHYEFKRKGVTVTALCPGPTATNFGVVAGTHGTKMFNPVEMMDANKVARIGLDALFKGKPLEIAGSFNKLLSFLARYIPANLVIKIAAKVLK